jgi:hypothetical protein
LELTARLQAIQPHEIPTLTRTMSVIEAPPEPLPGVSEHEWWEFRKGIFPCSGPFSSNDNLDKALSFSSDDNLDKALSFSNE